MKPSCARWTNRCAAGFLAASLMSTASAKDELPKAVRAVLTEESQTSRSSGNRRQQLADELVQAKASDDELYWNAGYVKVNGKWLPFEESFSPVPMTGLTREYLDRRAKAELSWNSQNALATWCRQHGMEQQRLAHLYHSLMVLPKDVDVTPIYQRMGYVRFGTEWLSHQEAREAQRDLFEYLDQLDSATPLVARFADELEGNRFSESSRRERLKQLAASNKIAALELVLATRSEQSGQAAVEAIRQIPTYQASLALGRLAVFSPWLFVRDSATTTLKERRFDHFLPQWLALLRTHYSSEIQRANWGRHQGFLCLFRSERDSEIEVHQLLVWAPNSLRPQGPRRADPRLQSYNSEVTRRLQRITNDADFLNSIRNDEVTILNEHVVEALQTTTGQKLGNNPKAWWDWWQDYNGVSAVLASEKPTVVIVKEEQRVNVPPPPPTTSCLVAGTPILTKHGLVAVEQIHPGDRVLSKNIETGELDYKVVLHTTVRKPSPLMKVVIGEDAIQATEGHQFWVSGRGWTKTYELAAEQPLHTPTGAVRVGSLESAESAPTYNLVVADFHTYFVGKSAIFSHDVLPPKPTNKVVPGLNGD